MMIVLYILILAIIAGLLDDILDEKSEAAHQQKMRSLNQADRFWRMAGRGERPDWR